MRKYQLVLEWIVWSLETAKYKHFIFDVKFNAVFKHFIAKLTAKNVLNSKYTPKYEKISIGSRVDRFVGKFTMPNIFPEKDLGFRKYFLSLASLSTTRKYFLQLVSLSTTRKYFLSLASH